MIHQYIVEQSLFIKNMVINDFIKICNFIRLYRFIRDCVRVRVKENNKYN